MFKDRQDAARQLCEELKHHETKNAVVVALPRGGVPIAYVIADEFSIPLDIILSKKVGHPFNKEIAIGSVSLYGQVLEHTPGVSQEYLEEEIEKIRQQLVGQNERYRSNHEMVRLKDKVVIIIDDGIATGNTILAGIEVVRLQHPSKIIVAVPIAPPETIKKLRDKVDQIICLQSPGDFNGVGQFYEKFDQISDNTVLLLLEKSNKRKELTEV